MTTPTQSPQERRGDLGESLLGGPLPKRWSTALYADRHDAGRRLGALLADRRFEDPLVVGIARGGMPVAQRSLMRWGHPSTSSSCARSARPGTAILRSAPLPR